jgi:hypothetical protein
VQPAAIAQLLRPLAAFRIADCGVGQGHVGISAKWPSECPQIYQQIRRMPTTRFGRLATPLDDV